MPYPKVLPHLNMCKDRDGAVEKMWSHLLDPTPRVKKRILVYVVDTSKANLVKLHKWENLLSISLGPDLVINSYGGCFRVFVDRIDNGFTQGRFICCTLRVPAGVL